MKYQFLQSELFSILIFSSRSKLRFFASNENKLEPSDVITVGEEIIVLYFTLMFGIFANMLQHRNSWGNVFSYLLAPKKNIACK